MVYSSQNPEKLSLSLKAGIPAVIWFLTATGNLGAIDSSLLNDVVKFLVNYLVLAVQFVLGTIAFFGFARKVYNTVAKKA